MDTASDWRQGEVDEPEASDAEIFGPEKPQDRLAVAIKRVEALLEGPEPSNLDQELIQAWVEKMQRVGDADEAERFADYLVA